MQFKEEHKNAIWQKCDKCMYSIMKCEISLSRSSCTLHAAASPLCKIPVHKGSRLPYGNKQSEDCIRGAGLCGAVMIQSSSKCERSPSSQTPVGGSDGAPGTGSQHHKPP